MSCRLGPPRPTGGWLRAPGRGVAGKPGCSRRLRARCSCTSSGARNPSPRRKQTPPPGRPRGNFPVGVEAPERRIVGAGRPALRGDSGDSEAWGWGGPWLCTPGPRLGSSVQTRRQDSPEAHREAPKPRGEYYRQGRRGALPAHHSIYAQICLILVPKSGSGRPWELSVFVALPPWGLIHHRHSSNVCVLDDKGPQQVSADDPSGVLNLPPETWAAFLMGLIIVVLHLCLPPDLPRQTGLP